MQLAFESREEAEAERVRRSALLRESGQSAFVFSEADRVAFAEARDRLSRVGSNVNEAVEFFLKHARPPKDPVGFDEMVRLCLQAKEDEGCDPRYVAQVRSVARGFSRAGHGLRMCHEIVKQQIEAWLRSNRWAPKTWNNYLTDLRTIFEWGRVEGYLSLNPCEGVPRKKTVSDEGVEFLSVKQCKALLERAAKVTRGVEKRDSAGQWIAWPLEDECFRDCVPMLVIGLFCGLRPEKELGRMTWADVKEGSKVVIVSAGRAKSRKRRTVDLAPNALEWLKWCRRHRVCSMGEGDRVCPRNLKRRWKRLREACAMFEGWPHDGVRHTFATYHYAMHQNEAKLQVLMGHRNAQMLHEHYRGLATPIEAREFWKLMPPK